MRACGIAETVKGLGRHDHVCWSYEDPRDFRARALEFLADGLALGQRVELVGSTTVEELSDEFADVEGFADLLRADRLRLSSSSDAYGPAARREPCEQVGAYASATEGALADGFTGFRVAAEITSLVGTAGERAAFARYEHQVDRYMAGHPFSALCGYRRDVLGDDAVAELACMHPVARQGAAPFRLYATAEGMELAGEVDVDGDELFRLCLERTGGAGDAGEIHIDATPLSFIDHRGLLALDAHASAAGVTVLVHNGSPTARKVARLLGLGHVQVEVRP